MGADEIQLMMQQISAAFLDPLKAALGNVAAVGIGLFDASIPLVAGLFLLRAAVGAQLPAGAMINSLLILGVAKAAIELWPEIVQGSLDQVGVLAGLIGVGATDPFQVVSAGAALATRAFDTAGAIEGYMAAIFLGAIWWMVGGLIFLAYLLLSALSLAAFVEFWGAAVILSPLIAFLPIVGFQAVGVLPFSLLVSSVARIAAIGMVASYGTGLIAEHAIPTAEEEVFWLQAFIALGLAMVMLVVACVLNALVSHVLMGQAGFASGYNALSGGIRTSAGMLGGAAAGGAWGGAKAAVGAGGSAAGGAMRRNAASLGASAESGQLGATSAYVNARRRSA